MLRCAQRIQEALKLLTICPTPVVSYIQKSHLNYLTQVEQFFLAQKGSGLALSAQDYHVVSVWEKEGVPLDRLCRAIEVIVQKLRRESRGGSLRLSLDLLREEIEAEMEGPEGL